MLYIIHVYTCINGLQIYIYIYILYNVIIYYYKKESHVPWDAVQPAREREGREEERGEEERERGGGIGLAQHGGRWTH